MAEYMKVCTSCLGTKPLECFSYKSKVLGTRQPVCMDCKRSIDRESYASNKHGRKQKVHDSAILARNKIRIIVNNIRDISVCEKCQESRGYLLDFHHKDSSRKRKGVSQMIRVGVSVKTLMEEIENCVILCANCHREYHHLYRIHRLSTEEYLVLPRASVKPRSSGGVA